MHSSATVTICELQVLLRLRHLRCAGKTVEIPYHHQVPTLNAVNVGSKAIPIRMPATSGTAAPPTSRREVHTHNAGERAPKPQLQLRSALKDTGTGIGHAQ